MASLLQAITPARRWNSSGAVAARVSVPQMFHPVLERLCTESAAVFGATDVQLVPLEYTRRRFSHLLRVAVFRSGAAGPGMQVFVKIFRIKEGGVDPTSMRIRVAGDFEANRRIHERMSHSPGLGAVRPVVCYPEYLAVVTEQVQGETLLDHLRLRARGFPSLETLSRLSQTMRSVGGWLRSFQSIDAGEGRVSLQSVSEYIDVRLRRVVASGLGCDETWRQLILRHLDSLYLDISDDDLREVLIHGDLAPANIIVSGERVVVLDFAMMTRGSALHDLSRLFLQLDLLAAKPQYRPHVIRHLQEALLNGYDPDLSRGRSLFRVLRLLHVVNHLTTLTLTRERFPAALYNWRLRRRHLAWIGEEVGRPLGSHRWIR